MKTCFCSKENLTFTLYGAPFGNLPNGTETQIFNSKLFETVEIPLPWMPEVFLAFSKGILRSGERNLWYRPLSSLRTPVQWDAVSYSQGAFHSTKNSGNPGLGSEWNRHFPEFHSEILGVPREVGLKFRKIGITRKISFHSTIPARA